MEIKTVVITQSDKRLDEIVFLEYGHLRHVEEILELNIKAIGQEVYLPKGIELKLPIYEEEKNIKEVQASTLW